MSVPILIFLLGLALCALAVVLDLIFGVANAAARLAPHLACALAGVAFAVAGALVLGSRHRVAVTGDWLAFGQSGIGLDRLSSLFALIAGAVEVPVALIFASWARMTKALRRRGLAGLHASTLAVTLMIITAQDVFGFVFAWEGLTFLFYLLAGYPRHRPDRARASLLTVGISKTGGAAVLLGWLLLAVPAGTMQLAELGRTSGWLQHDLPYLLLFLGFAAKVGVVPLQTWMPEGYAAAPGPARALMAGVCALVGFYGMWRTLQLLHAPPLWLVPVVLILGGVTALLGIAHTTIQQDLRRLVGYSSVENAGLIVTGYGVALTGAFIHRPYLLAAGLLAATLQLIAHAMAKSALFGATATFELRTGTTWLDHLNGLGRRMPVSGATFGVAALTLAGLPPTAGFVSEWFLLEALMQQFRLSGVLLRVTMVIAGALVALTAGFAAVAFVRIVGLVILGNDPRQRQPRLRDTGLPGRFGLIVLGLGCLGAAAFAPLEIRLIARGIADIVPAGTTTQAVGSGWVLGPVYQDFAVLSPSWLWIELPLAVAIAGLIGWTLSAGRIRRVRRVPAWRSAGAGVEGPDRYTPFAYANPTRRVLASVLLTRSRVQELEQIPQEAGTDIDPRAHDRPAARFGYRTDVVEVIDRFGYRPLVAVIRAMALGVTRLQSGRLSDYLVYMLIALIALITLTAFFN